MHTLHVYPWYQYTHVFIYTLIEYEEYYTHTYSEHISYLRAHVGTSNNCLHTTYPIQVPRRTPNTGHVGQ
jgi:hypothetical protein